MKKTLTILAASLLLVGASHAHPLDFLTTGQRVFLVNKYLQAQDELLAHPGKRDAADGSDAPPLTTAQRMMLMNWVLSSQTGEAAKQPSPADMVVPKSAALPQAAPVAPAAMPGTHPTSEADLAALFATWKPLETGVQFERFKDGFAINGARYLDPEGSIVAYGFDAQTGDFTYLAQSSSGQFLLKTGRASHPDEPVEIGKAERRGPQWTVTTSSGKKFSGLRLIPLARGFIVARENTGFRYVPGKGSTTIAAPEQFAIAALQSGNVSTTGYLLLERVPENEGASGNGLSGLFSAVKSLGSTLGMGKKEDYALLNIDSRKLVPINISMEDKRVQVMSGCRKRNLVVSDCDRMDSYESLFQPNGMHNMTHYFWRINWFNAGGRPILVSQEGGLTKVAATDLATGKKAMLFERAMGIASFNATQGTDGKIAVVAQMGFSSETRNDVVALLDSLPELPAANAERTSGAGDSQ